MKLRCALLALAFALTGRGPGYLELRSADSLLREGKLGDALKITERVLQQHPDSAQARRLRVYIFLKADRLDQAVAVRGELPADDSALSKALKHRDPYVRIGASKLAADQPTLFSFRVLAAGVDDGIPDVRRYCARALGKLGNRDAVRPLFEILQDDNWFVRAEAAASLGKLGDPRAAGWLVLMLRDGDGFVRYTALHALWDVTCESNHAVLSRALYKMSPPIRPLVAFALAKLHDPAALGPLTDGLFSDTATVRAHSAEGLGVLGVPAATNMLARVMDDPDKEVRAAAANAMEQLRASAGS